MHNYDLLNCVECNQLIRDQYYLLIDGESWHEKCAQCSICHTLLKDSCYTRHGHLFCRNDYMNRFGLHCRGCGKLIRPNDSVLRSYSCRRILSDNPTDVNHESQNDRAVEISNYCHQQDQTKTKSDTYSNPYSGRSSWIGLQYFHELCFKCCVCGRLLCPGEEYTLKGFLPICMTDYGAQSTLELNKLFESKSESNRCTVSTEESQFLGHSTSDFHSNNGQPNELNKTDDQMQPKPETNQMHLSVLIPDTTISAPSSSGSSSKAYEDRADEDDLFELDSDSESGRNCKRPRTILTATQRRRFKAVFDINPKPTRKIRESLAMETGLNIRVVQVWFQNQRAKIKKLARRHAQESRNLTSRKLYGSSAIMPDSMGLIKSSFLHSIGPNDHQNSASINAQPPPNSVIGLSFLPQIMNKSDDGISSFKSFTDIDVKINDELGSVTCLNDVPVSTQLQSRNLASLGSLMNQRQSSSNSPAHLSLTMRPDNQESSTSYNLPIFNPLSSEDLKTVNSDMSSLFNADNMAMQRLFLTGTLMNSLTQDEINALRVTVQGSQMDSLNDQPVEGPINKLYSMQHSYFM